MYVVFLAAQNLCPVFVFLDDTSMTFMAFDKELYGFTKHLSLTEIILSFMISFLKDHASLIHLIPF
jgi:hypothetical protein